VNCLPIRCTHASYSRAGPRTTRERTNPQLRMNTTKRGVLSVKLAWGIRSGETHDGAFSGCVSHDCRAAWYLCRSVLGAEVEEVSECSKFSG
jgi:hypothetical protein